LGGACSTHGSYNKYIKKFLSENLKERENSKGLGVHGRIRSE